MKAKLHKTQNIRSALGKACYTRIFHRFGSFGWPLFRQISTLAVVCVFHRINLLQRFVNKKCVLLREIVNFYTAPAFAQSELRSEMLANVDFALASDDYQALYKTVRSIILFSEDLTKC